MTRSDPRPTNRSKKVTSPCAAGKVSEREWKLRARAWPGRPPLRGVAILTPDRRAAQPEVREGSLAIQDGGAFSLRGSSAAAERIPFERTQSVVVRNQNRGALDGLLGGAIAGALVGLVLGSVFDEAACGEDGGGSRTVCPNRAKIALTVGGAALCGLIGAVVGSAIGHRTTFTF
jgi:hypothetical protein